MQGLSGSEKIFPSVNFAMMKWTEENRACHSEDLNGKQIMAGIRIVLEDHKGWEMTQLGHTT